MEQNLPEFGLNGRGGVHVCYPYYERMTMCVNSAVLPSDCKDAALDLTECNTKHKLLKSLREIEKQTRKGKLLRVPRYNSVLDQFEYPDGQIIKGEDPVFDHITWRK